MPDILSVNILNFSVDAFNLRIYLNRFPRLAFLVNLIDKIRLEILNHVLVAFKMIINTSNPLILFYFDHTALITILITFSGLCFLVALPLP